MKSATYLLFILFISFSILNTGCVKEEEEETDTSGTCIDGIQNRQELGIDCGGRCPDCPAHCFDYIKNFDEEGVDCGGPCTLCDTIIVPCDPLVDNQATFLEFSTTYTYGVSCAIGSGSYDDHYLIKGGAFSSSMTIYFPDTARPDYNQIYTTDFFESGKVTVKFQLGGQLLHAVEGQDIYVTITENNELHVALCDITVNGTLGNFTVNARFVCP